jgi:deoxyribonuclease-4
VGTSNRTRGLGKHCSIAGGLPLALERAAELGCTAVQFFSRNPRGWATRPLDDEEVVRFWETRERLNLRSVTIHTNYLVNLAAPDPFIRERSIVAFRDELVRAARLGADYLVVHPGSSRGAGVAEGVSLCIDGVRRAAHGLDLGGVTVLIENTAGQGDCIGRAFEQVAEIVDRCERDVPTAVCLDTAHTFAAGYELTSEAGFRRTMRTLDRSVGLARVRVIHFNDSRAAFASNVDRHWHLGEGHIGIEALARVARYRPLRHAALILETPVDAEHDDAWNFARLCELAGAAVQRA